MKDLPPRELALLLYAPEEPERVAALREITRRQDPALLSTLHEALRDVAPSSFFCLLVDATSTFKATDSFPVLREIYQRSLPLFARLSLLRAIASSKHPESEELLRSVLKHPESPLWMIALEGLLSRDVPDISAMLSEIFVRSALYREVATLLLRASDDALKALVLRLMFAESLSIEQIQAATKLFGQRNEASAAPLLLSWAERYSTLRSLCLRTARKLQTRL